MISKKTYATRAEMQNRGVGKINPIAAIATLLFFGFSAQAAMEQKVQSSNNPNKVQSWNDLPSVWTDKIRDNLSEKDQISLSQTNKKAYKDDKIYLSFPKHKVAKIAAGPIHACLIDIGGKLWCWGLNNYGQTDVPNALYDEKRCPLTIWSPPYCVSPKMGWPMYFIWVRI